MHSIIKGSSAEKSCAKWRIYEFLIKKSIKSDVHEGESAISPAIAVRTNAESSLSRLFLRAYPLAPRERNAIKDWFE